MKAEERTRYFQELVRCLRHEGLTPKPETADGFLPVELDSMYLCRVSDAGTVRYWPEDTADEYRSAALDKVVDLAKAIREYMRQMEAAPLLMADDLSGDYRLLAEYNDVVLAGRPTGYGVQFITWEWVRNHTALYQGNYYGPDTGVRSYAMAKQDFATRSGLVPRGALFTPEQLTEVYRSIHGTLESDSRFTDEGRKLLESAAEQIETAVPDLEVRVAQSEQKELEQGLTEPPQSGGMQFC